MCIRDSLYWEYFASGSIWHVLRTKHFVTNSDSDNQVTVLILVPLCLLQLYFCTLIWMCTFFKYFNNLIEMRLLFCIERRSNPIRSIMIELDTFVTQVIGWYFLFFKVLWITAFTFISVEQNFLFAVLFCMVIPIY